MALSSICIHLTRTSCLPWCLYPHFFIRVNYTSNSECSNLKHAHDLQIKIDSPRFVPCFLWSGWDFFLCIGILSIILCCFTSNSRLSGGFICDVFKFLGFVLIIFKYPKSRHKISWNFNTNHKLWSTLTASWINLMSFLNPLISF